MIEEKEKKKEPEIKIIDGIPCIVMSPDAIVEKNPKQQNSVNHPFNFGWLQETKKGQPIHNIIKEIEDIFNIPFMPVEWKVFKINENGEIKEIKDEDEENDNRK